MVSSAAYLCSTCVPTQNLLVYNLIRLALQLLRIETEGAYAALVAGSPSADAQEDAIRSASHTTLSATAHLLAPAITTPTSLANWAFIDTAKSIVQAVINAVHTFTFCSLTGRATCFHCTD